MGDGKNSGELLAMILNRVEETAKDVKDLTNQHTATQLALNDGKHTMEGLRRDVNSALSRIADVEKRIPTPPPFQAASMAIPADEGSDAIPGHRGQGHRRREAKTDSYGRGIKIDQALLIKIGMIIGAIVAGYMGAKGLTP